MGYTGGMRILECGEDRLEDIYRIENQSADKYNSIVPGFMGDLLSIDSLKQIMAEGVRLFCAEVNATPVGFIGYKRADDTVLVRGLFVLPDYQGKGVGSGLLAHFEDQARRDGARRALLIALAKAHWAIDFYTKHGFHAVTENKLTTIARYWPPMPENIQARHPDIETSLLEKLYE